MLWRTKQPCQIPKQLEQNCATESESGTLCATRPLDLLLKSICCLKHILRLLPFQPTLPKFTIDIHIKSFLHEYEKRRYVHQDINN